ncbi:MAG TPA: DNA starvation/stationary phase protection protein [Bryobacteraceae bacterium]|nr:DNA starvation/stationary phase protection protein [Bryobacteraceae bacterium]
MKNNLWKKTHFVGQEAALDHKVRWASVASFNQILADTMTLRDMHKKHHWQVSGPTFHQLHLFFDKHYGKQAEIVDALAERVQTLGGVAIATPISRTPRGRENTALPLFRLLQAHELIIGETREAARAAAASGDDGTNDLLVTDVLRVNESEVWFVSEQIAVAGLADKEERLPPARADHGPRCRHRR